MDKIFGEWDGARPQRFRGGISIVQGPYKKENDIFLPAPQVSLKRLEQVKSKRHFPPKYSESLPDWKPCLRVIRTTSQKAIKPLKITEIPCTTRLKALRHTENFTQKTNNIRTHTLWEKTIKDLKYQEEQACVRNLEMWEENTLAKTTEEELRIKNLKNRLDSLRETRNKFN